MAQITFPLVDTRSTTSMAVDATTSGPIKIPAWAPDIASMATTTIHDQSVGWYSTTILDVLAKFNPGGVYNKRCFNMKTGKRMKTGDLITIRYNAVGELVRT
jgi:hypothetical protein